MSLSFEEMADASLPNVEASAANPLRSKWFLLIGLACFVASGIGSFYYFSDPELPEAAVLLLSAEAEVPGVLPHQLDDATEFESSFDYLKENAGKPDYRAAEEVSTLDVIATIKPVEPAELVEAEEVSMNGVDEITVNEEVVDRASETVVPQALPAHTEVEFTKDWGGVVLVPDIAKLAKAHTAEVHLDRIEAHPIDGDRIRVWARILNLTNTAMNAEVGCEFRSSQYDSIDSADFDPLLIPAAGFVNVEFVSEKDRVESYTVLVKQ